MRLELILAWHSAGRKGSISVRGESPAYHGDLVPLAQAMTFAQAPQLKPAEERTLRNRLYRLFHKHLFLEGQTLRSRQCKIKVVVPAICLPKLLPGTHFKTRLTRNRFQLEHASN